jgi:hypothetical protein
MIQGPVTKHLLELIAKQVEERGLVVWYDPEQAYAEAATALSLPKTTIVRYDGSFFQLRREIDMLMNDQQPPRLVTYVPTDRTQTSDALVELEAAGVVMQPGQQPPNRNTRLAIVARQVLRPILGDETAAEVEKQVESGKLSLADLNSLASKGKEISTGVLTLIFGNANPQDVALAFLSTDHYDAEVEKKSAHSELLGLLQKAYDIEFPARITLPEARDQLVRHVLLTELVIGLGDSVPASLASVKLATLPNSIELCTALARNWRLRRDARDSYVAAAGKVENNYSLSSLAFKPECLRELETFLALERALSHYVEQALLEAPTKDLLKLADSRLSRFWADVIPAIQARWALITTAAEVLLEAERVTKALKKPLASVATFIEAYTENDSPWCLLDTHHRHLESRWYNFEPLAGEDNSSLEKLVVKAEQRYTEVGSQLAKHFVTLFSKFLAGKCPR